MLICLKYLTCLNGRLDYFEEMSVKRGGTGSNNSSKTKKDDLLSKEEEFKRLNDELEKKTNNIVYEAEQILKAHERNLADTDYLSRLVGDLDENVDPSQIDNRPIRINSQPPVKFKVEDDLKKIIQKATKDDDDFDGRKSEELDIVPKVASEMSSDAQIR